MQKRTNTDDPRGKKKNKTTQQLLTSTEKDKIKPICTN